jgi:lysophospholipase L1-like esterase
VITDGLFFWKVSYFLSKFISTNGRKMDKLKSEPDANPARRTFIKQAGIGAAAAMGLLPEVLTSCTGTETKSSSIDEYFSARDVILFQGDSITDAGRDKEQQLPNNARSFGTGYAYILAASLLKDLAGKDLTFYNRGISGNKVYQLAERWQEDCLDLKPDVLSILIGVNDFWHMRNGRYEGTPDVYENDYRELLNRTRSELPGIKLVICEPFVLSGTSAVDESWLEPFKPYQESAAKLAREFDAKWVPFQAAFTEAAGIAPPVYWTADGVHPSMPGCQLMAETWLNALL